MLPLGEVELGPAEPVAEVLVGPPAVGADGGARGARPVNAVAHRAPAPRLGNGEDDTALLVDLALVVGHPVGAGAGAPLEDDLLAFLGRVVLADDGPLGAAGALHTVSGSDDAGQDRDPDLRLLLGGLLGGRGRHLRRGGPSHGRREDAHGRRSHFPPDRQHFVSSTDGCRVSEWVAA